MSDPVAIKGEEVKVFGKGEMEGLKAEIHVYLTSFS